MTKTHFIFSKQNSRGAFQRTACGKEGVRCDGFRDEYDTPTDERFEAVDDWRAVTCKSCIRAHPAGNPDAKRPARTQAA
jgi:hypothetical protein